MLNPEERKRFWATFKNSPLFREWKDAETNLDVQFERVTFTPGQVVFHAGETAEYLYLVGEGVIVQSSKEEGVEWLRRRFTKGDYFGQHVLFGDQHHSEAIAETDGELYKMFAGDLRTAMERNSGLYEDLLQEKRASRLRSIPLLRALNDSQIIRLCLVMEELSYKANEVLPLGDKAGLWIIDFGQVTVAGPASLDRPDWRLTAGNFFFSPGVTRGARCAATSARTHLPSKLFFLPAEHAERLINAFSGIGRLVARPLDIVESLEKVELFTGAGMTAEHRQHLAQFFGWGFVPDRQNITTQGARGHSFVILREGAAMVANFDEQGRARPQNYLRPMSSYGATSLLEGRPRDATVRAVIAPSEGPIPGLRGADVLTLDRRDLQYAFAERTDLWRDSVGLVNRFAQIKEERRRFKWQNEEETITWEGRSHLFWLLGPLAALAAFAVLALVLGGMVVQPLGNTWIVVWLLLLGVLGVLAVWFIVNYYDDHYVVTNRRVTRYDRQLLLFSETLMEAPIETIQDVTVSADFWGRFFDWGNLAIRTAAKVGAIVFTNVPEPEVVKKYILEGKAQALAVTRGQQKEVLRRLLITNLRLVLPIPERKRALGDNAQMLGQSGLLTQLRRPRFLRDSEPKPLPASQGAWPRRFWRWVTQPLPARLRKALVGSMPPVPQVASGQIVWRKHPVVLVARAGVPFLTTLALLVVLFELDRLAPALGLPIMSLVAPWLLLMFISAIVLAWQVADYYNDLYVLTDDKIIDIEMKPLGLDYRRREGNLERVQSVDFKRLGLLSVILDYGTVTIRTAAADEGYDFIRIGKPARVQEIIFQKLDALRERQETKKAEDRQREMIESLQVYDNIRDMGDRRKIGV